MGVASDVGEGRLTTALSNSGLPSTSAVPLQNGLPGPVWPGSHGSDAGGANSDVLVLDVLEVVPLVLPPASSASAFVASDTALVPPKMWPSFSVSLFDESQLSLSGPSTVELSVRRSAALAFPPCGAAASA